MIGYGANKGIVPMFCEELFNGIDENQGKGTTYEVKFSMLEIYNEVVRDLLDPKGASKKGGLAVRQHPKKGFYGKEITGKSNSGNHTLVLITLFFQPMA